MMWQRTVRRPGVWSRSNWEGIWRSGQGADGPVGPVCNWKNCGWSLWLFKKNEDSKHETGKWATWRFAVPFISFCSLLSEQFEEFWILTNFILCLYLFPLCRWGKMLSSWRTVVKEKGVGTLSQCFILSYTAKSIMECYV
jgi:hypothetical protein